MTHDLPGMTDLAIETLRKAGLYARRYEGTPESPVLIIGGSHTEDAGGITLIQNVFQVTIQESEGETPKGYLVRYPADRGQLSEEVPFEGFLETIEFVLRRWAPLVPGEKTPREEKLGTDYIVMTLKVPGVL